MLNFTKEDKRLVHTLLMTWTDHIPAYLSIQFKQFMSIMAFQTTSQTDACQVLICWRAGTTCIQCLSIDVTL